jgi:hypothetical protein
MHQSSTVRDPAMWYATLQTTAAFRRTITAITTLALYSITSGALALFVPDHHLELFGLTTS